MNLKALHCAIFLAVSVPLIAQEKEAGLGRQMASELRRHTQAVEDSEISEYVDRIGQKLAKEMPGASFPFSFAVIKNDLCPATHEPASLPGGYVFVPAALLIAAHSEAEFAGMLAHAMEHIALRHGRVSEPGTVPLIFIGGSGGSCSERVAIPIGYRETQRMNELEADVQAVQAIARAGYDPQALADYAARVPSLETERVAKLNSAIEQIPAADYVETTSEFAVIRNKTAAMR